MACYSKEEFFLLPQFFIYLSTFVFIMMELEIHILSIGSIFILFISCITILIYCDPQIVPYYVKRHPFKLALVSFYQDSTFFFFFFWALHFFLAWQEAPLYLPCPALESVISPCGENKIQAIGHWLFFLTSLFLNKTKSYFGGSMILLFFLLFPSLNYIYSHTRKHW